MSSVRGPCCRERFYFGLATFQVFLFPPNKRGNKTNIENCVGFFKRKPVGSRKLTKNSLFFFTNPRLQNTPCGNYFRTLFDVFQFGSSSSSPSSSSSLFFTLGFSSFYPQFLVLIKAFPVSLILFYWWRFLFCYFFFREVTVTLNIATSY